jgi:hypothetical protein
MPYGLTHTDSLTGCNIPYVLRPKEGYYYFMGDYYVHGIMNGDAIDMLAEGKFEKQTFDIH